MLILRLRQSEVALAAGRFDEAFQLATENPLASHRRGQRLITRLADALVRRGNEYLTAGRYGEALADCEKAAKLAGNLPSVVALRAATVEGITTRQRQESRKNQALADVRRSLDAGQLSIGAKMLGEISDDTSNVRFLRNDIEQRRNSAQSAARAALAALKRNELHVAAQQIGHAHAADPQDSAIIAQRFEIHGQLRQQVQSAIEAGQLERAAHFFRQLQSANSSDPELQEFQAILSQLRETWRLIEAADFAAARIALARVASIIPKAKWLQPIGEQLESADRATGQLKMSALAWMNVSPFASTMGQHVATARVDRILQTPAIFMQPNEVLPSQMILHVDAVGSFLVLRQPQVIIGPISGSVVPDIALMAEPNLPALTVQRLDDDYFLKTVGAANGKLLNSGDRLELSPRCRLTFTVPSPASTSAVLDLSGARLPRSEIRRVILMDQDIIIGPGSNSHVQSNQVIEPIVLHVRQGQLFCQSRQPVHVNGQPADSQSPLPLGANVKAAGVSFVMTRGSTDRR